LLSFIISVFDQSKLNTLTSLTSGYKDLEAQLLQHCKPQALIPLANGSTSIVT
jgi:hypothetical protein